MFSSLVGAEIVIDAGATVSLDIDPAFEHGILLDSGSVTVGDGDGARDIAPGCLAYVPAGAHVMRLAAGSGAEARVVLLGGEPFGEQIVMWWNFVGRSHEDVVAAREAWQGEDLRFGVVEGYDGERLPAPALPNIRLRPRE